jgi:hypothetical protein
MTVVAIALWVWRNSIWNIATNSLYAKVDNVGSLQAPQTAEDFLQSTVFFEEIRRISESTCGAPAARGATLREALSHIRVLRAIYRPLNGVWTEISALR